MYCGMAGACESARLLLGYGADVGLRAKEGLTALHFAAGRKGLNEGFEDYIGQAQPCMLQLLLAHGSDVDAATHQERDRLLSQKDYTPLHYAVESGNIEAVRILLEYHADPNKCSDRLFYPTPLLAAIEQCNGPLVRLLLEHGADMRRRSSLYETPEDVAHEHYCKAVVEVMRSFRKTGTRSRQN